MAGLLEWWEERRTEGLGAGLSLAMIAAGLAGLLWFGWGLLPGHGSTPYKGRNLSAVPFLREQAEGGHARSQYNLECCYANGEGVIEDMDKVNK